MRSVTNIQKITKAMKMVAASKMRVAQVNTERSRGLIQPFLKLLGDLPGARCTKQWTRSQTSVVHSRGVLSLLSTTHAVEWGVAS